MDKTDEYMDWQEIVGREGGGGSALPGQACKYKPE